MLLHSVLCVLDGSKRSGPLVNPSIVIYLELFISAMKTTVLPQRGYDNDQMNRKFIDLIEANLMISFIISTTSEILPSTSDEEV